MSLVHFKRKWTSNIFKAVVLKCDNPACGAVFRRPASARAGMHDFCSRKCSNTFNRAKP